MKVIKRDGTTVSFKAEKIVKAIENAMLDTKAGITNAVAVEISEKISEKINEKSLVSVDEIQDMVEDLLMASQRKDAAKQYILYRYERDKTRGVRKKQEGLLTDAFISQYKHKPSPMDQLGNFVYYRTYSRWLPEERRREYWWETVRRAVEYNCSLAPTSREEAEKLYDNIFNLKQFLSGRTFWVGGTKVATNYPMANYNCAFVVIDHLKAFRDLFYLLMVGAGVGVRVLKDDVKKLPKLRTNLEMIHEGYDPVTKEKREDNTSLVFIDNHTAKIVVGDSKEGWVQSIGFLFDLLSSHEYRNLKTLRINYNHVRPKGEALKTFGGTASGHTSIRNMFLKIDKVLKKHEEKRAKIRPIDCLDIVNIIGENVVVGGVRRTAEIVLVDPTDQACIEAKNNLYQQVDGKWVPNKDLLHRQMSNNSIYYKEKPSRQTLHWQLQQMRYSGEPGWVNEIAAKKRRDNMNGVNPCGEILLDSKGLCNLTTINVMAFLTEDNLLDEKALLEAQKLSARAAYRMTCVELEIPEWNDVQQRDKLTGCSLTGWQDLVNAVQLDKKQQEVVLAELRQVAREASDIYAESLGMEKPLLVTTVKPEGTLSQLPGVSSGVHYSHSPYYVRRVRINAHDPLVKVCEDLNYTIHPEVGQDLETCTTKVIEFPVKAPKGITKYDVSAIEQLENYKLFMKSYVDHNCSITIHVRDHEWEEVEQWVWDHWDDVVALSFLSLDDNFYELLPYEAISEEDYLERIKSMKPFIPSLLGKYEVQETDLDVGEESCESGICPIR